MEQWNTFINELQEHGFAQWEAVRDIVQALQEVGIRLPSALPGEDGCVSLSWTCSGHSFLLDVTPTGLIEWFHMDHATDKTAGIEEPIPFDRSAPYVRWLLIICTLQAHADDPDPWMDEPLTDEERALPTEDPQPWLAD
ncbi:MAG: hypothetical protein ACE366_16500 [Bradymonadia bacterium]